MQRSTRVGRGPAFICVTFALFAALAMSVRTSPHSAIGGLSNPDTYMRLVRLRDILRGGVEIHSVARDGSGHGTVLHWSHLIDGLLCVLAAPFGLLLNPDAALHAAAVVFGPLNIACLAFAVAWAAAPFADREWLWLGAILSALSPAIISYGVLGVVHHHVAIVVVAVACWGWAARIVAGVAPPGAGLSLGAWAGLGVWLTPETMPLSMMAFAALWLAWIVYPARGDVAREIGLTGLSFALVTVSALLADPPEGGIGVVEIDRLSLLFGGLAVAVAGIGTGLWGIHRFVSGSKIRTVAACLIGTFCCAVWAAIFHGAIVQANQLLHESQPGAMFDHIAEMLPVAGMFQGLHFLMTGMLGVAIAIVLAVRRRSWLLGYAALCLVGLLAAGGSHVRFAAYSEAAGAIALPIAITMAATATVSWHQIGQSFARLAIIMLFILLPFLGQSLEVTASAHATQVRAAPACEAGDAIAMLLSHPGEVVLADVNDTPELLYKTEVRTVGSLYHRNPGAFSRLRTAWRAAPSDTVPPEIDAAEISLVLACESPRRSPLVEDLERTTLFDQTRTGHPPPWLAQIDENPASGQVLYRVVRPGVDRSSAGAGNAGR
jgi:hypothetical protein